MDTSPARANWVRGWAITGLILHPERPGPSGIGSGGLLVAAADAGDDVRSDVAQLRVLAAAQVDQVLERLVRRASPVGHDDALRLLDAGARGQCLAKAVGRVLELLAPPQLTHQ